MSIKSLIALSIVLVAAVPALAAAPALLDVDYRPLAAKTAVNLNEQQGGKVLLIVNTASKCGFTHQYEGLEALQQRYVGRGFAVLGFPSNDFKGQEPGSEEQIQEFCTLTYGVKFPMYEKVHVTGPETTALYQRLHDATGVSPAWNFHKYLVSRDGRVVGNWPSKVEPDDPGLVAAIERELKAPPPPR
jgi:glutathione peroxidase